jgi:hypothetical protein
MHSAIFLFFNILIDKIAKEIYTHKYPSYFARKIGVVYFRRWL